MLPLIILLFTAICNTAKCNTRKADNVEKVYYTEMKRREEKRGGNENMGRKSRE